MSQKFTAEQQAIIHHPLGQHARVLAVAGSGKTTTMVQRVKVLVTEKQQDPRRIRVVMFNRMAREDFERKIAREIPDVGLRPKVYTFHGLAHKLREDAAKFRPTIGRMEGWFDDKEELALICMHRAIDSLLREGMIDEDIDARDALDAVGLWKASLIPPERAGHRTNPDLALVYRRFEEFRQRQPAITFDDFVPVAMELFKQDPSFRRQWEGRMKHIIVDEYQDINYGQQQLVRILAGHTADVMVVGDDDQTIYEWRGARPYYILQGFQEDFSHKPIKDYQLSRSFRFGPLIAQTAYNSISLNKQRQFKPLVAHSFQWEGGISILTDESEQSTQISVSMAQEINNLVRQQRVPPQRIIVLGRTFVQMEGLQTIFIRYKIPFRVVGKAPFFERDENRTLIDYVRLALALNLQAKELRPWHSVKTQRVEEDAYQARDYRRHTLQAGPSGEAIRMVLAVANTPSRMLARKVLQQAIERGASLGLTVSASLETLLDPENSPLRAERRESLQELLDFLYRIAEQLGQKSAPKAGEFLSWIIDTLDYQKHFTNYYGEGEASSERINSVGNFLSFAAATGQTMTEFVDYLSRLDPTLGLPENKLITMTSVYRTKGLEFDYVFIPACTEGNMPVHLAQTVEVYDTQHQVPNHPLSPPLEGERRLFYVALTRAVKQVYIGTIALPTRGQQSRSGIMLGSRFLEEMQLSPTQLLIEGFQRLLLTETRPDTSQLLKTIRDLAGYRHLVDYVAEHYLTNLLWPTLIDQIKRALNQLPRTSFQYQHQYPDLEQSARSVQPEKKPEPPAWEDPWDKIGRSDR